MGRVVAGLFLSLDGVVDGAEGWQYAYFDEELGAAMKSGARGAVALLLGRRSYEGCEALRVENPDSPVLALMDARHTYVVSTTLRGSRRALEISQEDLAAELEISQSAISQLERAGDLKLSTLRKYLEKLGARLELVAVFDTEEERAVPIHIGGNAS